nr:hypothetical protein [Desulfomicrobium apsheronum]
MNNGSNAAFLPAGHRVSGCGIWGKNADGFSSKIATKIFLQNFHFLQYFQNVENSFIKNPVQNCG